MKSILLGLIAIITAVALAVPDGMATQQAIIRDVLTGAVIGYGLHEAGGNSSVKNSHNVPAEVTP